jgi:DNA uptake protein ComE-like DNA-binding protein
MMEEKMGVARVFRSIFIILVLIATWSLTVPPYTSYAGDPNQKEVAERIEINAASRDQLLKLGVLTPAQVDKIIDMRQGMGDFTSYEELEGAGLDKATIDKLRPLTTINHMATDCNC